MHNYDEDYFVMLKDYKIDNPLKYEMGEYGALRTPEMWDTHFSQPIRFDIFIDEDEGETYSGKEPEDAIFNVPDGLIVKHKIVEENFLFFNQENTVLHNAYIVSPDDKYFEGYIFIPTPMKPLEWLDKEKSSLVSDDERINYVKTYSLNSLILDQVEELQRCFFEFSPQDIGVPSAHLIHRKVVDILMQQKRNIKFIPLADYHVAMALGGKDFPKSAI